MLKLKITIIDKQKTIFAAPINFPPYVPKFNAAKMSRKFYPGMSITLIWERNLLWPQLSLQGMPHLNNRTSCLLKTKKNLWKPPFKHHNFKPKYTISSIWATHYQQQFAQAVLLTRFRSNNLAPNDAKSEAAKPRMTNWHYMPTMITARKVGAAPLPFTHGPLQTIVKQDHRKRFRVGPRHLVIRSLPS